MASCTYVATPEAFAAAPDTLDWAIDPATNQPFPTPLPVSNRPGLYRANGGGVTINSNGWLAELRTCDPDDIPANFPLGEGVVVAQDPTPSTMPDTTPLRVTFERPVRGVGAGIGVVGSGVFPDLPLHAVLWVQLTGSPTWLSFSGDGVTGPPLPPGAPPTAPFVGAMAGGADTIQRICVDATLMGNRRFKLLVLPRLMWVP